MKIEIGALERAMMWTVDDAITNPDGDQVWLRGRYDEVTGKRVAITDCCLVSEPCEHHARIAKSRRALS